MKFDSSALRLYAVTDRAWLGRQTLEAQVEAALRGGATLVQLREKELGDAELLAEAVELRALCHDYGVPLIINDRVEIALRSGADGVHVGQGDMRASDVRALAGEELILGVTARTPAQARDAEAAGADYIGCGAAFGSSTKLDARAITHDELRAVCRSVAIPVVAIGGINAGNILRLAGTGVAGAAIVSGIFASSDIEATCRQLRALSERMVAFARSADYPLTPANPDPTPARPSGAKEM